MKTNIVSIKTIKVTTQNDTTASVRINKPVHRVNDVAIDCVKVLNSRSGWDVHVNEKSI